ncbi:glycerol-3-phosphate acyltransferase [Acrasis kona]|uniref:Glycerol-3-phosphate acyltransferase n=1 Tax=Acrasis kona TaxID=1008807 RepID=A0AAW2Z7Y7_9EUKA
MEVDALRRLATYKGQNVDTNTISVCVGQVSADASIFQKVDSFILSGRRSAGDVEEDYIITLLEWYKSNITGTVVLLLRHVPSCISAFLNNKEDSLVSAILLCVYNVEVSKRINLRSLEGSISLLKSLDNVRTIYNIGDPSTQRQVQAPLTARSLDAANRVPTTSHLDVIPKEQLESYTFETEVRPRVIHVCMQVFNNHLDLYSGDVLLSAAQIIQSVTISGMPYQTPTFDKVVAYTANQIQKPLQKVVVDLKTNAISFVPLEPNEIIEQVKPTHLHMFTETGMLACEPLTKKRFLLQESILLEFAHTMRYMAFNLRTRPLALDIDASKIGAVIVEALYSLHARGTYQCYEKVILHTQSVLQQL